MLLLNANHSSHDKLLNCFTLKNEPCTPAGAQGSGYFIFPGSVFSKFAKTW